MIGNLRLERWGYPQRPHDVAEVVRHVIKSDRRSVAGRVLAEGVAEPVHAPIGRSRGSVLPLDVARGSRLRASRAYRPVFRSLAFGYQPKARRFLSRCPKYTHDPLDLPRYQCVGRTLNGSHGCAVIGPVGTWKWPKLRPFGGVIHRPTCSGFPVASCPGERTLRRMTPPSVQPVAALPVAIWTELGRFRYFCPSHRYDKGALTYMSPWARPTWVHVFRSWGLGDFELHAILNVMRKGPTPHSGSKTQANEKLLGIEPPCVYIYLARGEAGFGNCAMAVTFPSFPGSVSPFDTGGLLDHTSPLQSWPIEDKRRYLNQHTWCHASQESLAALFAAYPGDSQDSLAAYARGEKPTVDGPHAIWPNELQAKIWTDIANRAPRTWTWEARIPERFPSDFELLHWSCPSYLYVAMRNYYDHAKTDEDYENYKWLNNRYVDRGVTGLLAHVSREWGAK